MNIHKMTQEDIPAVSAIERACFSQPWSPAGFSDALRNPNAIFWVAKERGEVLGYLGMYVSVDEGEITNVAVGELFRGRGVGRALMDEACRHAAECCLMRIILEVRVSNASAIALYERCGFTGLGVRKDFYELPREDAEIMLWNNEG